MSSKTKKPAGKAQRSAIADVVAREYTIHLHKRVRWIEIGWSWQEQEYWSDCTAPRRHIQEAGTKSYQGDQEVRREVNGTLDWTGQQTMNLQGIDSRWGAAEG
jgi:hypothetical protein